MSSRSKNIVELARACAISPVAFSESKLIEKPICLHENSFATSLNDCFDIEEMPMIIAPNIIIEDLTGDILLLENNINSNTNNDKGNFDEDETVNPNSRKLPSSTRDSEADFSNHFKDIEKSSKSNYKTLDIEETNTETDTEENDRKSGSSKSYYKPSHAENTLLDSVENENGTEVLLQDFDIDEDEENNNDVRKRRHKANEEEWIRNKNKKLRMKGEEYLGIKKDEFGKLKQNIVKSRKIIKPRCTSKSCESSSKRHCSEISEQTRNKIHNTFWETMNWDQRQVFVSSNVTKHVTKRKTVEGESRRQGSYTYTLNGLQVCRNMFINTLSIGYKSVQSWVNQSSFGMFSEKANRINEKQRVKLVNKTRYEIMDKFFEQLPKLPAHYCRKDSLKMYLEPHFQTLNDVYKVYLNYAKENLTESLERKSFSKIFYLKNLSVYTPKKDQCNTCVAFKCGNILEEVYVIHQKRKEDSREEKSKDKVLAQKKKCIAITMDVQAVKLSPFLNAGKIYFKTKLCCHNFTVYNLATKEVVCYWWSEDQNNQLVASTFTSFIIDYLQRCLTPEKIPIIIWSDGCPNQNRNNILSNALLNFSIINKVEVFQKYLEPGHTQMECDSVHSSIERKLRNREIHLPSDYVSVSKEARVQPFPYEVKLLEFDFFKNYSLPNVLRYNSIRPGKIARDHIINEIRVINYSENGIKVKLNYKEDYIELPCRMKNLKPILEYPPLLTGPCKIKEEKYQHLQQLKTVIPKDTHDFFVINFSTS